MHTCIHAWGAALELQVELHLELGDVAALAAGDLVVRELARVQLAQPAPLLQVGVAPRLHVQVAREGLQPHRIEQAALAGVQRAHRRVDQPDRAAHLLVVVVGLRELRHLQGVVGRGESKGW